MSKSTILSALLVTALAASAATAQLLGGGGGALGGLGGGNSPIGGTVGSIGGAVDRSLGELGNLGELGQSLGLSASEVQQATRPNLDRISQATNIASAEPVQLVNLRAIRLAQLIRANRATLDRDGDGQPVRKNELVATDPDPVSLALAHRAGFRVLVDQQTPELGLRIVTLAVPRGMNVREALKTLRKAAPTLDADYNHIFEPAGAALLPAAGAALATTSMALAAAPVFRPGTRIAMIDGGVASHPALARAAIEQRGFAGAAQPTGHGTAVGSLLVGEQGAFRGAARGARLFVGDVYGGNAAAGSATTVIRALAWAATKQPSVINISLVGPGNAALARAIAALRARGIAVVAAVGNDGPAAPPQYPASYPGVIAVTGVDASDRALREAGRSTHIDFAAPGADLVAASPGKGFAVVRGTSFAAPLVTARLAAVGTAQRLVAEADPGKGRVGQGIVCRSCRIAPKTVGLK